VITLKVLLINAPVADIKGKGLGLIEVISPPLGISYIAAVLEKEGVEVDICDAQNLNMNFEDIGRHIIDFNPDIIGISCFTPNYPQAQQVAELAKHVASDAITVIGGPHVTFTAARTLRETPFIDVVVRGEGEYTMVDLVRAAEGELQVTEVPGISYRLRGMFVNNPDRPFITDLDSLPFPARHLWPEEYMSSGMREVPIITSRGCPYGCVFCSTSKMAGHAFRARSPKNVVDELQQVVEEYDFNRFVFKDDTFTLDNQRVLDICEEILQRGLEITWACSARVDTVTPELLSRISEAGCNMIYYGVESGNQEILDNFIGKRITLEQAKNAIQWAHDVDIATVASYIIGFPGEKADKAYQEHLKKSEYGRGDYEGTTKGTIFESLACAEEMDSDLAQVHLLTPYPGTRVYDEPESLGIKILTDDFTRYNLQLPIIETNTMSVEELWNAFVTYMNEVDTYNSTRTQRRLKRRRERENK
jgi:radical SAM superfamily enzyme YgiQ (UPF0313 family)